MSDSDQEASHSKLIEAVTKLDKRQRVKKAERSEPSLEVSEYHLVKSGVTDKDTVCTRDLIKLLEQKGDQTNVIKTLRYIQQKNKVLSKPLEKPAAERIKRTVGYDKVKEELQKWDSIVVGNRAAEKLVFPLKEIAPVKDFHDSKTPDFLKGFSTKSDLMKKFEEVDPALLHPADKEEEKDNKYKMTLEEVILRRKEAARFRAQQSYREAKAHRQRKIKSKKFHRIQRKDKIKQQLKDFEKLKDSNPEEALAKLEQLDRTRAEERMSLRHKNTGNWARNKQIKAKYNKETRQILSEQLAISRELTQKVKRINSSDEEDEEDEGDVENTENMKDKEDEKEDNIKTESEINDFIKLCRNYYDKKQTKEDKIETDEILDEIIPEKDSTYARGSKKKNLKRKLKVQETKKKFKANDKTKKGEEEEKKENEDYSASLEFENSKRKPILDSPLEETTSREQIQKDSDLASLKAIANSIQKPVGTDSHEVEIDPKKYVNVKPNHLKTQLPDVATYGDEDSDQEEETHRIMSEAFADDDVVEEFRKEKEEEMKKSQPQSIDLSLPGWGSWGGPNIKKSKIARKKSRFTLTVPKPAPRKPENKGEVIIFEHENEKLRKHLVKELPYPFTRVKDFEASIRAPISRTFVPMNAHMRLIQPTVRTKLGQVIEPMNEDELIKKQQMVKKPLKRIDAKNDKKKYIVKNVKNIAKNSAKNGKKKNTVKNSAKNGKKKNTVKNSAKNGKKKNTVKNSARNNKNIVKKDNDASRAGPDQDGR